MAPITWRASTVIVSPVYIDSNIVVGALVRTDSLYTKAVMVVGDLLAQGASLVLSDVTMHECHWALAKAAYAMLSLQGGNPKWTKRIYQRHRASIFANHSGMMSLAKDWAEGLHRAGHPVSVVQSTTTPWLAAQGRALAYMNGFGLTAADASHLALAEMHARSFVTADGDYRQVYGPGEPQGLAIVVV